MDEWEQGQHVSILGQTGQGKSVLANEILKDRQNTGVAGVSERFSGTVTVPASGRYPKRR
jgi:ABC-type glutathione transport system ATPase component